jgi:hypothetical protein
MKSDEQLIFSPFPCCHRPASSHLLRDLPAHRAHLLGALSDALTEHYRQPTLERSAFQFQGQEGLAS